MSTNTLEDFLTLPIEYPPTASFPQESTHNLYIRQHTPKVPTKLAPQSLFIANIPPDTTAAHLTSIFTSKTIRSHAPSSASDPTIAKVLFPSLPPPKTASAIKNKKRKRPTTDDEDELGSHDPLSSPFPSTFDRALHPAGSAAIVVLHTRKAMTTLYNALKTYIASPSADPIVWPTKLSGQQPLGSARYKMHQTLSRPTSSSLSQIVEEYMVGLSRHEAEQARKRSALAAVPDEDGFITVTRGPRTGPSRNEEAAEALEAMKAKEAKKRDSMQDFYRFQLREKRKERERELKGKFEGDVERVRRRIEQRKGFQ